MRLALVEPVVVVVQLQLDGKLGKVYVVEEVQGVHRKTPRVVNIPQAMVMYAEPRDFRTCNRKSVVETR